MMGKNSRLGGGMLLHHLRGARWVALSLALLPFPQSREARAAGQAAGTAAAAAAASAASTASAVASAAEMALGTSNMSQGQSTQNQAQMLMGAMQIASAILGMLASLAAAKQAGKGNQNTSGLSGLNSSYTPTQYQNSLSPYSPTDKSGASGNPENGSLGQPLTSTIDIGSPEALRSGAVGDALNAIEKNYGIPRDKFVDALKGGVNPKDLLASASKNTPSAELLNKIADGLAAGKSGESDAARLLASNGGIGAQSGAGGLAGNAPAGDGSTELAKGAKAVLPDTSPPDEELVGAEGMNVSPEIRAAMAARAAQLKAEAMQRDMHGWSIFQLVHNRYQKLETMLYGRVERTNPNPVSAIRN